MQAFPGQNICVHSSCAKSTCAIVIASNDLFATEKCSFYTKKIYVAMSTTNKTLRQRPPLNAQAKLAVVTNSYVHVM